MKIRQYRPAFFEGFETLTVEFKDTAELLAVPFVKSFSKNMKGSTFLKYSRADEHLMAEYMEGKKHTWYIVGTLIGIKNKLDLPRFE